MQFIFLNYIPVFIFLFFSIFLANLIFGLSYLLSNHESDTEKLSTYECGFDAYEDSRKNFEVRFFLVGILFLIFDLEISFLFPWALTLGRIGAFGFWTMMTFLIILTLGFVYEWKKGALDLE